MPSIPSCYKLPQVIVDVDLQEPMLLSNEPRLDDGSTVRDLFIDVTVVQIKDGRDLGK